MYFLLNIKTAFRLVILSIALCACNLGDPEPPAAVFPVPGEAQLKWHNLEQYAFIHFTTNTFTNLEWGYGDEDPSIFNPSSLDTDQWASVIHDAGLKGIIITAKHHDGFCLWPSRYTEHTVKNSPYKNGDGDVVAELAASCKKFGLKFGIYLSPWDRNHKDYASEVYIEYYRNQLRELLEKYPEVFEVWFDGANGGDGYYGGTRETRRIDNRTYYDWPTTINLVRQLTPDALMFSDAGPDIRWCGNERGFVGETNWNLISTDSIYPGKPGIVDLLNIGSEDGTHWIPAEVDVSIRPGWFYHPEEDDKVKSPEELFNIYLSSVGRGSNLLLNIPPDKRGLIHENDVKSLMDWKKMIDEAFSNNLASTANITANTTRANSSKFSIRNVNDGDPSTYWSTNDNILTASIEIDLGESQTLNYLMLQEYLPLGQRIKSWSVEYAKGDEWVKIAEASTVGYKRILPLDGIKAKTLRIKIQDSKACPVLSSIQVY
ncbi:MAG: alpha-L-fucosidase [Cyclobacteriaceae bacterium]|nr:alpha-L-fucosidase [Cyclobacteriaceae bacterium]